MARASRPLAIIGSQTLAAGTNPVLVAAAIERLGYVPNLLAGERKLVVMMSSDLGSIANNTLGTSHAYRSSKAALNMVTRGLGIDLKGQGITVISLAPGWTRTDLGGVAMMILATARPTDTATVERLRSLTGISSVRVLDL